MTESETQFERLMPEITNENQAFWDACANGVLVAQECLDCGNVWNPPMSACPRCLSERFEWSPLSGRGSVYTWTLVRRQYRPGYPTPYNVAVIQLEEGPRILGNIVNCDPGSINIGDQVEVSFAKIKDGVFIPEFTLSGAREE